MTERDPLIPREQDPHDPSLYFPPLPNAEEHMALAEQLAAEDRRQAKQLLKFATPFAAISVGAAIWLTNIEVPEAKPGEPNDISDCTDFSKDVLKSPTDDHFGVAATGPTFNPKQISTEGMAPIVEYTNPDGQPVLAKSAGKLVNHNGKLEATGIDMPNDYRTALERIVATKALRWGICQLDGGMEVTFTNSVGYVNGEYTAEKKTIESRLITGTDTDPLYPNQRAWGYMVTHEEGHELRQLALSTDAQPEITNLYQELGRTYETHLQKVLEDYRKDHGKDVVNTLDTLGKQLNALDDGLMGSSSKTKYAAAVAYLKEQLNTPDGLKDLAITHIEENPNIKGSSNISLTRLNGLIAKASTKVNPEDPLYGVDEILQDSAGKVDPKLITNSDKILATYIDARFPSEKAFEGNKGGHPDNDDELSASLFVLTGYSDASKDDRIIANLPNIYRADAKHELSIARQIREEIDPSRFAKPLAQNSTSIPASAPSK